MENIFKYALCALNESQGETFKYISQNVFDNLSTCRIHTNGNRDEAGIHITEKDVKKIIDLFDKIAESRLQFLSNFDKFSRQRKKSIQDLKSISKSLQKDKFNGNISKIVGSSVGIIGGGVIISSLFPPAAPFVLPLAVGGTVASTAGGFTVLGTTITEIALIKKRMSNAQDILKEDEDLFFQVLPMLSHCNELVEAIESVLGFSLVQEILKDVSEVIQYSASLYKETTDKIFTSITCMNPAVLERLVSLVNRFLKPLCENFSSNLTHLKLALFCVCFIISSVTFDSKHRSIFACIVTTHRIVVGPLSASQMGIKAARAVSNTVKLGSTVEAGVNATTTISKRVVSTAAVGMWAGLGIALDVVSLALATIDIHKGSLSDHAQKVENAALKLDEELQILKNCHKICLSHSA